MCEIETMQKCEKSIIATMIKNKYVKMKQCENEKIR